MIQRREQTIKGTLTRWERRKEATHQRLMTAGERLFRTKGFDATTVEEIAVAADVAKGTFFNYFDSKEALLGELLYFRTRPLLEAPPAEGAPADRIWRLLQAVRRELEPYVHLFQHMFAYAMSHPLPEAPPKHHLTLAQAVADLVREGQHEGIFDLNADADVAGALLSTYFFRLCVRESICEDVENRDWENQMRSALNLVVSGLKHP